MGTLLLQAQDQHYSSSKSMAFPSPKKATRKLRNSSSFISRFPKPDEEIPRRERVASSQSHFQSDYMCSSERERSYPKVDQGSISGMEVEKHSSAKILTTRNSSSMKPPSVRGPGTCPEATARKHAQSVKSSKKGFSNREQEHANAFSLRSDNSAGFSGKRSVDKDIPRVASNKNVSKVAFTKAVSEGGGAKASQNLPMKVTIMQRPQTKEEALSNISKFTGVPLAEVYAKNGLTVPFFPNDSLFANSNISSGMPEKFVSAGGELLGSKENTFAGGEDGNHKQGENTKSCHISTVPISAVEEHESSDIEGDELFAIQEEGRLQFFDPKSSFPAAFSTDWNDMSDSSLSPHPYFSAAKWSGLCLCISPPPSSLPIPKFATLARTKMAMSEVGYADELKSGYSCSTASGPASPLEGDLCSRHDKSGEIFKKNVLDTAVATNDLKRLLHLGFP